MTPEEKRLFEALGEIIDPETGVDIVSMGMVKGVKVEGRKARVKFVPTSPFCPILGWFADQIVKKAEALGLECKVEIAT